MNALPTQENAQMSLVMFFSVQQSRTNP